MTCEEIIILWNKGYSKKYIVNLVMADRNREYYKPHLFIKKEPKTSRLEAQQLVEKIIYDEYMRKLKRNNL